MHENDKLKVVKLGLGFFSHMMGLYYVFHTNLKDMGMCDSWCNIKDALAERKKETKGKEKIYKTVGAIHSVWICFFKLERVNVAMG